MKYSEVEPDRLKQSATPEVEDLQVISLRPLVRNRFRAKNFLQSLGFALEGLRFALRTQRNFRIDVVIGVGVVCLGVMLGLQPMEWAPLILVMGVVLFAESMNTAIEYTVDLYTQGEFDMRAKIIKDLSAGACLISAICAAVVGSLIFAPRLWTLWAGSLG